MKETHFTEDDRKLLTQLEIYVKDQAEQIKHINEKLDNRYVTREEFKPIKSIVYGEVGIVLTAVLTALIYLVVQH